MMTALSSRSVKERVPLLESRLEEVSNCPCASEVGDGDQGDGFAGNCCDHR